MELLIEKHCKVELEDKIEVNKDGDGDIQLMIFEDVDLARVCLSQEDAKELALAILDNLDI